MFYCILEYQSYKASFYILFRGIYWLMHKATLKNSRTLNAEESTLILIKMFIPIRIQKVLKLTEWKRD